MPFGIIDRTGPEMRQVWGLWIGPREGVLLGANVGRAIVTNGDFTTYVCAVPQPSELPFGVVRAVGRGIAVLHGVHIIQGEGRFWGFSFPIFTSGNAIGSPTVKCFRFVYENFTTFPFGKCIVGRLDSWDFWQYIRFQDQHRGL